MKKISLLLSLVAIASISLVSCVSETYNKGDKSPETTTAQIDTLSYGIGVYLGRNIVMSDFGEIDLSKMREGLMDVLDKKDLKLTDEQIGDFFNKYMMERGKFVKERNLKKGQDFLKENKVKEGVVETESGLQYKHIQEGTGISPKEKDTVEVHYTGTLIDGTEFDSSKRHGQTVSFPLDRVIKGWTEGIQHMKEGGKMMLYVPSELGYGSRNSHLIPANSVLIFEVELVKVKPAQEENKK